MKLEDIRNLDVSICNTRKIEVDEKNDKFKQELSEAEMTWIEDHVLGKDSRISFLNYIINCKQKIIKKVKKE